MLELAILGLLKEQELHGYELKKRLSTTLGFGTVGFGGGVSFGSLYPALRRLEQAGAVKAVEGSTAVSPTIPMTGSLGGELAVFRARKSAGRAGRDSRGKKVYGITDRGETLFEELLATENQSSEDDRVFNLRLAFARHLPPDARLGMLERRRGQLLERLVQLRARLRVGRERSDPYTCSLMEHDREAAEHDLTWIDRLIESERAGGPDGAETPIHSHPHRPARPAQTGASGPSIAGLRSAIFQEDKTP
jgi:DNA-binding PadR family transcriptional regulator